MTKKAVLTIPVEEFSTLSPYMLEADETLLKAVRLMRDQNIRHLPIVKAGRICGIISERDLNLLEGNVPFDDTRVGDFMAESPYVVAASTPLDKVAYHMSMEKIGSAVVVDAERKPIGIFTATDALNALIEILRGDYEI